MLDDFKFCQRCGEQLSEKHIEGLKRRYCPHCGFIVFLDPKVAAVVLVGTDEGLLMVQRGVEPEMGKWAFPSGYVDRGEVVESAAIREVMEETGLEVAIDGLIGVYSMEGNAVALVVYSAHVIGGMLKAGHDAQDAKYFALDQLPPLPFPHDAQILSDWQKSKNAKQTS